MKFKFIALAFSLSLGSYSAMAGVKVTSLDLKTAGSNGYVNITLDGRSNELPDVKVYGKTIEIILDHAETFSAISKNISGAQLSANVLNGKAIVKAILPYTIPVDGVNLGWKNSNIEVIFPRGRVVSDHEVTVAPKVTAPVVAKEIDKKIENKISKDILNEDYLNKLMKDNTEVKTVEAVPVKDEPKKDEIKVSQAAIAKTEATKVVPQAASSSDNFSFAGYAAKFTIFLAMVLGLFYGIVQLLKKGVFSRGKLGFLNNSQMIQVLSTTYVAPKRALLVVKAHKQIFLVASSESGLTFLSEMTDTTGLIKEGEKLVSGTNFDLNLNLAENSSVETELKLKENINESTPAPEPKGIASLTAKDIVKFSDELKKKAKKLKPIEFN